MASTWFVRGGGNVYGPFDAARLKRLADEGKINEQTDLATSNAGPWQPAGRVRGLFSQTVSNSPNLATEGAVEDPPPSQSAAAAPTTPPGNSPSKDGQATGAESFGKWYRRTVGSWNVALQILAWVFGGYFIIPLWWAFSGNAPVLKIGMWIGGAFAALLALTVVMEFVDPEGMKKAREQRAKASAEWREKQAAEKAGNGNLKGAHVAAGIAAIELKNSGAIRPRGDVLNALARKAANELRVPADRRDEFVRDFEWAFDIAWDKSK
jgi:hypothetical protein